MMEVNNLLGNPEVEARLRMAPQMAEMSLSPSETVGTVEKTREEDPAMQMETITKKTVKEEPLRFKQQQLDDALLYKHQHKDTYNLQLY